MALLLLPTEVKIVIFVNAWIDVETADDIYQNDILRLHLQSTCRALRDFINDFPLFWTCISAEAPHKSSRPFDNTLKSIRPCNMSASSVFVSRHIQKSLQLPLHVAFGLPVPRTGKGPHYSAWDNLVAVARRWESLFLVGVNTCSGEVRCVAALLRGNAISGAVSMKRVNIAKREGQFPTCWIQHKPVRLLSSQLQSVHCQIPAVVAFIPSHRLQYLDITINRDHKWSTIFFPCINLTHLRWYSTSDSTSTSVVTLPSLTTLTLCTVRFLPPIQTPVLSTLEVLDNFNPMSYQTVVDLTGILATKLTTVLLSSNPTTNVVLLSLFRHCPNLQHLTLSVAESRTVIYYALCNRIITQYRRNRQNGFKEIAFNGGPSLYKAGSRAREAYTMLSELCESSRHHAFKPFQRGTNVIVCNFPCDLSKEEVEQLISPGEYLASVLKVWVTEKYVFGQIPQSGMSLVVLLNVDWEQAQAVASQGLEYKGRRYLVQCNEPLF